MNKTAKHWVKGILLVIATGLAGCLLLVAAVLFLFDDADYRDALVWAADRFLDSSLEIAGPFSFSARLSDGITIAANDVRLRAHDDSYSLSAEQFSTNFRLISLLSGALLVHDLRLAGLHLQVNETAHDTEFHPHTLDIPPVVIAQARFNDVTLEYREPPPGTVHTLVLHELLVDDVNDAGPVSLKADGELLGRAYTLRGTLPPLADMLSRNRPHPVDIEIDGEQLSARIDGHIADLVNGAGLDLRVQLQVRALQELLDIFAEGVPELGSLQASASLQGDYAAPGLDDIELRVQREQALDLAVTGKVGDALTGTALDLQIRGQSNDPVVASWLLFRKRDRMQSAAITATLREQNRHLLLSGVDVKAVTSAGLELVITGAAEIYRSGHVFGDGDSGLAVRFSAPDTAAWNLLALEGVPELGAAEGSLTLLAGRDAVGLRDIDVRIGRAGADRVELQGAVGRIGLQEPLEVSGIDVKTTLSSPDIAAFGRKLDLTLPALGPGHAQLRARGTPAKLMLTDISIRTGRKHALLVTARGAAGGLNLAAPAAPDSADLDITATAPRLTDLSPLVGTDLPALGRSSLTGKLRLRGGRLRFEPVNVKIGPADQPVIRLNGQATTILHKGSSVDASFDVAATDLLMAFTKMKPGYLGRLEGSFRISDMRGEWGIEQFSLASAQTRLYRIEIEGGYEDFNKTDLVNVKASLAVNDPAALGAALNIDLDGIEPWQSKGSLSTSAGKLVYNAKGSLGKTTSTTFLTGSVKDDRLQLAGKMQIPVLYLRDFGYGRPVATVPGTPPAPKPDRNHVFSREPLNTGFLNDFDLDFELLIDQVESGGQLSIDSVDAKLQLDEGRLRIVPLKLIFEGGTLDITLDANLRGVPTLRLQTTADDMVLGPLLAQVQDDVPITGYSNIDLDLTARGRSPHEIAASLDGSISLGLENARIPAGYVQYLSVDVFGWALSHTFRKTTHTDLNCIVLAFDAEQGVLTSRLLLADGPSLTLGGRIKLNLGAETMNIVLIPKQKHRIFSSMSPVRIKGPLLDPRVEAVPVKAAVQEVGSLVLLPGVVIPVRLFGKLWSLLKDGDEVGTGCAGLKAATQAAEEQQAK